MSINLLEKVQQNLGYPPLKKIDPNTEKVKDDSEAPEDPFAQSAIPAVITALAKYSYTDAGATDIIRGDSSTNWVGKIFLDNTKAALDKICSYSHQPGEATIARLNEIANETVKVVKENLPKEVTIKDVKTFFSNQRNTILLYLPTDLHMGELLHDDTIDDNVNKMEGPISSLMHSIGSAFSNPVTGDEVKKP